MTVKPRTTPADAAAELLARREARNTFQGYADYQLRRQGLDAQAAHHRLICAELDKVERGETKQLMFLLPPGSAKSTFASVLFPDYYLSRQPSKQVIAASHTLSLAETFGRKVRNAIADPIHRNLFPNARIADDSAAAGAWSTADGGGYYACGVGGSVTGRRSDVNIIDDPVASREDADSERMRDRCWNWYTTDLRTRLKPGGATILIQTRWHEDDLAGRLLELERDKWRVIELGMEAHENDPLGRQEGEQLWKEWFTAEMVEAAKQDPRAWSALYQQRPRPMEGAEFKRSWVQRYNTEPRRRNTIILCDPAGDPSATAKRKRSDYTVFWVVGLGADNNLYILDCVRDRLTLKQRVDTLFRLHRQWRPTQVRYERYGMQADVSHIRNEQDTRDYRFPIIEVAGQVEKRARIRRLLPWFEGGRVWFPHSLPYTPVPINGAEQREVDLVKVFLEEEYATFPVGRHDDMFDALARIDEPDLELPWPGGESIFDNFMPEQAQNWQALDPIAGW